jgi:two-component system chemotaxis sensor kinase CheA
MSGGRTSSEFLSEAQEVVEAFSRNLLELDAQQRSGEFDPDLLNAAFRAVHSLKGLAALFGAGPITELSHALESTLDALRLGRISLSESALDVLFESVETFGRLLAAVDDDSAVPLDLSGLLEKIAKLSGGETAAAAAEADAPLSGLDESILGVLTEYEEHRLRENVRMGRKLYRVHASFDLLAIDVGIEELKAKMKEYGEVITYLPSADSGAEDRIELDILVGSDAPLSEISAGVTDEGISVAELQTGATARPEPAPRRRHPTPAPESVDVGPAVVATEPPIGGTVVEELDDAGHDFDDDGRDADDIPELSLRSLSRTVRVDLTRLDHLMNLIGELGVVHVNLDETLESMRSIPHVADATRQLQMHLRSMQRKLSLLQQGVLDVRMVPLGQVFDKLARVVRKLGREAGKDIRLNISGSDTELDKLIVEELSDPLMHMIRNCIDHGIEPPDERVNLGKPATGRIDLRAFQKGNRVVIEVEDDGRGMDWRRIRETAVRRRLISEAESRDMGTKEVIDFIFLPGFSTRGQVSTVSGRGVGMDVVKTNISGLSGMIDVSTDPGRGTKFAITLPVTLAIIQALVVETAGQTFCIPLNAVVESVMVDADDIKTVEGFEVISLRGKTLPLLHLSQAFDLKRTARYRDPSRIYVVVVGLAQHRVGLVVDELLGQQDVVIKPLGKALGDVPGLAGATEMGGGRTVLLVDVSTLVDEAVSRPDGPDRGEELKRGA